MKIAIKVLTEWDRENVIPFFEKHFPNCNESMHWHLVEIGIGDLLWVDEVNDLRNNDEDIPSDYTILQGVPEDMELPKIQPNIFNPVILEPEMGDILNKMVLEKAKSREQELEECLRKCQTGYTLLRSILNQYKLGGVDVADETLKEIEQLLNK